MCTAGYVNYKGEADRQLNDHIRAASNYKHLQMQRVGIMRYQLPVPLCNPRFKEKGTTPKTNEALWIH